jgi:hypothetical protein
LKISQLYEEGRCAFTKLKLAGNSQITQVAAIKLGKALRNNNQVTEIDLHGLCVSQNGAKYAKFYYLSRIIELIPINGL